MFSTLVIKYTFIYRDLPSYIEELFKVVCWSGLVRSKHNSYVTLQIVNPETLQPVQQGEHGEIWIRGPMTAKGYLNLPQATAEMFLPDGFVRTGKPINHYPAEFMRLMSCLSSLTSSQAFVY